MNVRVTSKPQRFVNTSVDILNMYAGQRSLQGSTCRGAAVSQNEKLKFYEQMNHVYLNYIAKKS